MSSRPYVAHYNRNGLGFSLIELMIAVVIVSILAAISFPSYQQYVIRASREAAQTELVQMTILQEKIYLNSNAYSASVTSSYNGTSGGGLGNTTALTADRKYTISVSPNAPGQTFTLTATPVAGTKQAGDGNITIDSTGQRLHNGASW